ncbi:RNA-binding protein 1-like isoform X2 [Zingiber officinale]|uniref:RNA-binding protein 1-like isoform X2 n=1 Tax=Zingiber officinale TaxID=94328 RepID=UPI001C4D6504|nr:RNA-binding protein 1-like isoform X2 [Zingiber officinale]XP_042411889.1 RNA-binding protein 1-like isoform X2 [Zingiber officinale]XP_042411890.1 RNA-binding protein 1-like isoform X2 [Zingiber officinale]XP_042411891.1 RNA-binding protein 1-like isoform X2 [Zingiber officinale]XP_042411892.1 RNA-binding protein 1-like isoform X2 [Zingiber officinale]
MVLSSPAMADPYRKYLSTERDELSDPYRRYSSSERADPSDSYRRYPSIDRDARAAVPSYMQFNTPSTTSHPTWSLSDSQKTPDLLHNDMLPARSTNHGFDDHTGMGAHASNKFSRLSTGDGDRTFSPLVDPALARDVSVNINHDIVTNGQLPEESNILFVECLPTDCTRREVSHLFRPFIGFKEIRVLHKEPRGAGDKAKVLCFVEFDDAKCASTALNALQGYKFDDKKPNAPVLQIQFVKFPFRPASLPNSQT